MNTEQRVGEILKRFEALMPEPKTELHYTTPFELLTAVILSAQCTDRRVNLVTPSLFDAYPNAIAMAEASVEEIYTLIKSISFPNNKARSLKGMAVSIRDRFCGEVPDNMTDLLTIPGVGRKTANVILSVIYNKPAMAVDTHVFRVSKRLGLTPPGCNSPEQTEQVLTALIPDCLIPKAHHWLILHGRYICKARRPECFNCHISEYCSYYHGND